MATTEVSHHQVRIYLAAKSDGGWMTVQELAVKAKVARRTAAVHLSTFVDCGIFEQAVVFPGHRYRLSKASEKRDKAFMERLNKAISVFDES